MNFADPGVWCWQIVNVDYNRIKAIAEAGFSWVAFQIVSGKDGRRRLGELPRLHRERPLARARGGRLRLGGRLADARGRGR